MWSGIWRNVDLATVIVPVSTGCPSAKAYDCTCLGPRKFAWLRIAGVGVRRLDTFAPLNPLNPLALWTLWTLWILRSGVAKPVIVGHASCLVGVLSWVWLTLSVSAFATGNDERGGQKKHCNENQKDQKDQKETCFDSRYSRVFSGNTVYTDLMCTCFVLAECWTLWRPLGEASVRCPGSLGTEDALGPSPLRVPLPKLAALPRSQLCSIGCCPDGSQWPQWPQMLRKHAETCHRKSWKSCHKVAGLALQRLWELCALYPRRRTAQARCEVAHMAAHMAYHAMTPWLLANVVIQLTRVWKFGTHSDCISVRSNNDPKIRRLRKSCVRRGMVIETVTSFCPLQSSVHEDVQYIHLGLSENSVPLHPMVNDHYPY